MFREFKSLSVRCHLSVLFFLLLSHANYSLRQLEKYSYDGKFVRMLLCIVHDLSELPSHNVSFAIKKYKSTNQSFGILEICIHDHLLQRNDADYNKGIEI